MGQPVIYWQILSKQPGKLAEFYSSIVGWNVWPPDALGNRSVETVSPGGIPGGIWQIPQEAHSTVQLFIRAENVPEYVQRVQSGGGKVIFPPQLLPSGDEVSIVQDIEGIPFGIFRAGKRILKSGPSLLDHFFPDSFGLQDQFHGVANRPVAGFRWRSEVGGLLHFRHRVSHRNRQAHPSHHRKVRKIISNVSHRGFDDSGFPKDLLKRGNLGGLLHIDEFYFHFVGAS